MAVGGIMYTIEQGMGNVWADPTAIVALCIATSIRAIYLAWKMDAERRHVLAKGAAPEAVAE